jgi:hypothetical protein
MNSRIEPGARYSLCLVELGRHFNDRLLEQEQISQDCFLSLQQIRELSQSTLREDGQRASALRFADPRLMAVMEVLACHTYIPKEIDNRSLRGAVAQPLVGVLDKYSSAQMTYDLRRLRLKGLIARIGKSHRYHLTDLGIKVVTSFTKLYHRLFAPGLAALLPDQPFPSDLANALKRVAEVLQSWSDQAFALPVLSEI